MEYLFLVDTIKIEKKLFPFKVNRDCKIDHEEWSFASNNVFGKFAPVLKSLK